MAATTSEKAFGAEGSVPWGGIIGGVLLAGVIIALISVGAAASNR